MAASNAASGILSSMFGNPTDPYTRLVNTSLEMFHDLAPGIGGSIRRGHRTRAVRRTRARPQRGRSSDAARGHSRRRMAQLRGTMAGCPAVRDMEPELSDGIAGGIFMPEVCRVNNQRLSAAYARSASGSSDRPRARRCHRHGAQRTPYQWRPPAQRRLQADHVIIAAGPWTSIIAETLGSHVPTRPVRGVNLNPAARRSQHQDRHSRRLGFARPSQRRLSPCRRNRRGSRHDDRVTAGAVQDIMNMSELLVPSLRDARLNWAVAGLRPGSPDDAPMLGSVPGWQGLHVATGHYRSGILLSAITGKLMADHITDKKPALIEHFSPRRFRGA